jgi:cytoskeletal protein CcmA (bactofilin family)
MKRIIAIFVAAPLLALAAAGCSSSSSSSTVAKATPSTMTGTETFTSGKVTNAKVLEVNSPTVQLTYTGPVSATGSFNLGGSGPKKGQIKTFVTSKGNLVLMVASDTVSAKFVDPSTCLAQDITTVHYTVVGNQSTGSFKSASGSGVVSATFQANSELKGKCSLANNAEPATMTGAYILFTGTGPLTIKS